MKNATVLIVVGKESPLGELAKILESIRAIPAHASILVVGEIPVFPYYAVAIPPYGATYVPDNWQEDLSANTAELSAKVDEIQTLLAQHDVSGEVATFATDPSLVGKTIAQRAMFCDMVMVSDDLRQSPALFNQVVHGALFQSPVGVVLNDNNALAIGSAKRVFVAWNTQLHSARAVHQALPILRQAEEVIVAAIDPVISEFGEGQDPCVDLAKWLTHQGCTVVVKQVPSGGLEIGECILARSKEAGADLIVMGAYGHSRTREALFGGTTRTMIAQTDQAVLLAH